MPRVKDKAGPVRGGAGEAGEELVELSRIDAEIRRAREEIAAQRHEIDDLKRGRLSTQSLEVLLTDISDIWTNTGQIVGLERQQRDELRVIADAWRDMVDEVRALRARLEGGDLIEEIRALRAARVAARASQGLAELGNLGGAPSEPSDPPSSG